MMRKTTHKTQIVEVISYLEMVFSVIAASVKLPVVQESSTTIKTRVLLLLKNISYF